MLTATRRLLDRIVPCFVDVRDSALASADVAVNESLAKRRKEH